MGLSFVKEGPCSGGLGRLVAHAANACLTLDVRKSETGRYLHYYLDWEAFAISRLIAPALILLNQSMQKKNSLINI